MKEQFVPYEIAIKLKEKAFNEPCLAYYNQLTNHKEFHLFGLNTPGQSEYTNTSLWNKKAHACSAPLWQQVIDWLRDKHNKVIDLHLWDREDKESWEWMGIGGLTSMLILIVIIIGIALDFK
jgi:hypothetical protein